MVDSIDPMHISPESRGTRRPSTIRDVASRAGVSKSTASRALLGQSGVSAENLEKVRQAIQELDFVPNQIARSLSVQSPKILGLFLRSSGSLFYAHLAAAFEEQAGAHGYEVLSVASGDQPDEANHRSLMLLAGLRTAGIVVATPTVYPQTIRQVASRVPLALVGQMGHPENPHVPFVAPDPAQGGVLLDHIINLGHTSIALITYPPEHSPTQWARITWMQKQLETRRFLSRIVVIDFETNLTAVIDELHRTGVTAILCNTDSTALDAIASASHLGLSVPHDLSIAGYDGVPPFDHETIGLTTYRIPIAAMATAAVLLVDKLVRAEEVDGRGILLRGELLEGRTTGPRTTS
jgi:LacI family transcriptional regulator